MLPGSIMLMTFSPQWAAELSLSLHAAGSSLLRQSWSFSARIKGPWVFAFQEPASLWQGKRGMGRRMILELTWVEQHDFVFDQLIFNS